MRIVTLLHLAVAVGAAVLALAGELGEDPGDAAGHGLEGLAREAHVGGAQATDQAGDQLQRDLGVAAEEAAHVVGGQRQQGPRR